MTSRHRPWSRWPSSRSRVGRVHDRLVSAQCGCDVRQQRLFERPVSALDGRKLRSGAARPLGQLRLSQSGQNAKVRQIPIIGPHLNYFANRTAKSGHHPIEGVHLWHSLTHFPSSDSPFTHISYPPEFSTRKARIDPKGLEVLWSKPTQYATAHAKSLRLTLTNFGGLFA